jgi:hypothetical protein
MTKHLADHRNAAGAGRLKHFLRIARDRSDAAWRSVWQRPRETGPQNQRLVEYVRIERGRLS